MPESMTSPRRINATERQRQAVELRKAGLDYRTIAERLGYNNPGSAYHSVEAALKKMLQEPVDELRALELSRLDRLELALWQSATQGNHGAIDRVLRLMERRAKLLGLDLGKDVPTDVTIRVVYDGAGSAPADSTPEAG